MITATTPLFERLGGATAVDAAVDRFYEKVLADARIKHFFTGIDMDSQRRHQKMFLSHAFGGTAGYDGRGMRAAHRRLVEEMGLDDGHFDAVVENLAETLTELGVDAGLIGEVAGIAESIRADVLGR